MALSLAARIAIGDAIASVEFDTDVDGVVNVIWIRNSLPVTVRVIIHHDGSGYNLDSEFVLTAPISINLPKPRRFPNDDTASVAFSTQVRSVA